LTALEQPAGLRFDLVVAGGRVLGPDGPQRADIGVVGERVTAVAPDLPAAGAARVDASGCLVLPGLVDMHTHVFAGGGFWGTDPLALAWRSGVTTWVDAGSAGAFNFDAFRRSATFGAGLRVKAFINISAIGLVAETGECADPALCDPAACLDVLEANRDVVVGVKCRMDRFSTRGTGTEALERALAVGRQARLPVMVHIGPEPPTVDDVLSLLGPGDIVTHCATGQGMALVGTDGDLRPSARRARDRGVRFDVGHGSGGFCFAVAEALLSAGVAPDVISSDTHQRSIVGPMFDLPTCLSKFLALGLPLPDAVAASTATPARLLGLGGGVGRLEAGGVADIAVFALDDAERVFHDVYLRPRPGRAMLVNRATVAGGRLLAPQPPPRLPPWATAPPWWQALQGMGSEVVRRPWLDFAPAGQLPRPHLDGPVLRG
jgi:dihydroorotase